MENASKALLIAGGVLIAVLVLSLGVYFARNISDSASKIYSNLDDTERTEFNQQFLIYEDKDDLTVADVATIINLANDSNSSGNVPVQINGKLINETGETTFKDIIENNQINSLMEIFRRNTFKCEEITLDPDTQYVNYIEITVNC